MQHIKGENISSKKKTVENGKKVSFVKEKKKRRRTC